MYSRQSGVRLPRLTLLLVTAWLSPPPLLLLLLYLLTHLRRGRFSFPAPPAQSDCRLDNICNKSRRSYTYTLTHRQIGIAAMIA